MVMYSSLVMSVPFLFAGLVMSTSAKMEINRVHNARPDTRGSRVSSLSFSVAFLVPCAFIFASKLNF